MVYDHLRAIAATQLRGRHGHTLQPTALVHEAFMRLAGAYLAVRGRRFRDADHLGEPRPLPRGSARAMRQILIDHARGKSRRKRGGGVANVSFEHDPIAGDVRAYLKTLTTLSE